MLLGKMSESTINEDVFNDGQNKIIPDNTILEATVSGGFMGCKPGQSISICYLNIQITEPGEYLGQIHKQNMKIFDTDKVKRDRSIKHLMTVDFQAGSPMANAKIDPTSENIDLYWVGKSVFRVKFGLMTPRADRDTGEYKKEDLNEDGSLRLTNWIRGFAPILEKAIPDYTPSNAAEESEFSSVDDEFGDFE